MLRETIQFLQEYPIATTFGINAFILSAAFIFKEKIKTALTSKLQQDVETLKSGLQKGVESLKSDLQKSNNTHQIMLTKWHERKLDAISNLYGTIGQAIYVTKDRIDNALHDASNGQFEDNKSKALSAINECQQSILNCALYLDTQSENEARELLKLIRNYQMLTSQHRNTQTEQYYRDATDFFRAVSPATESNAEMKQLAIKEYLRTILKTDDYSR